MRKDEILLRGCPGRFYTAVELVLDLSGSSVYLRLSR